MTARITDTDKGLAAVAQRMIGKRRVRVGVLSDAPAGHGDVSLLEIAVINEFGAPGASIPQRSFIRATIDANIDKIRQVQAMLAKQIVAPNGIDGETAMKRLGAFVAGLIKQRIAQGIPPANAPATVERKGSSTTLVDTGQLRSSVTFQVEEGD